MTPCVKLESDGAIFFGEFLDDLPNVFNVTKWEGDV